MHDSPTSSKKLLDERRARLRQRLVGGAFTALLAVQGLAAPDAQAAAARPLGENGDGGTIAARVDRAREDAAARNAADATARPDEIAPLWGNHWLNWRNWNNWKNWSNQWNNWSNTWNNWSNTWNNWSNYRLPY